MTWWLLVASWVVAFTFGVLVACLARSNNDEVQELQNQIWELRRQLEGRDGER